MNTTTNPKFVDFRDSPMLLSHKGLLTRFTLIWHLLIAIILFLSSRLPSFDSSAALVVEPGWRTSFLRWDVFHYAHIAQSGYVYEHEYAFFPGVPIVMRTGAIFLRLAGISTESALVAGLVAGSLASTAIAVDTVHTLYDLSVHHLHSPYNALLVSLLSLLSSSPSTLRFAPYAGPFFTYFSYKGMLYCARRQFLRASVVFALASSFRSNGTMLSGYIAWGTLIEPLLSSPSPRSDVRPIRIVSRIAKCFLLSLFPVLPFLWQQYAGYIQFCDIPSEESRPWCTKRLPSLYSYVQSEYWDVGPFRYWTLQQSPNILLALPVLALLFWGSISYLRHTLPPSIRGFLQRVVTSKTATTAIEYSPDPFYSPSITPHAIHALVFSTILLTSAHTQIALRLVSALPFTYWTAARLFLRTPRLRNDTDSTDGSNKMDENTRDKISPRESCRAARLWVGWSMVWGAVSLVTWGTFLPPA